MEKIKCVVVEDEPVSQEILKRYIDDYAALELVAVCSNAIEANTFLHNNAADLIFLDINMPKISGLEFYRSLADPPAVIFTTAYPEYAVNGFEVNAVDYLVKPFPFERFLKAMNKFQDQFNLTKVTSSGFILLPADKKLHKVNHGDIFYIEAMGDYAKVHLAGKVLVVHQTLQKLLEQLPAGKFYRTHKSYIISLPRMEYIEGNMVVIDKQKIPIGQTYRNDFLAAIQKRE